MTLEPAALRITATARGWALVGDIDASNSALLDAALEQLPEDAGDFIEIDVAGVTFIDSSGMGCLIRLAHRVQDSGVVVALVNVSRPVTRLIELAELQELFELR